jgi:flagellar biosynthesis/type III secretory pathway protein FliH
MKTEERAQYDSYKYERHREASVYESTYVLGNKMGIKEGKLIGMEKGIKKGKKEGIEKGRREGVEKGRREGIEKGKKEGIEKGRKDEKIEVAINLLKSGVDHKIICASTKLTDQELTDLIKSYRMER